MSSLQVDNSTGSIEKEGWIMCDGIDCSCHFVKVLYVRFETCSWRNPRPNRAFGRRWEDRCGPFSSDASTIDQRTLRAWWLYLNASQAAFASGGLQLWQMVIVRDKKAPLTLTREPWLQAGQATDAAMTSGA
jgi:hypothetical protein